MKNPMPYLNLRSQSMKSKEKCIEKLKQVLKRLSLKKTVQNLKLKTVLAATGTARYCYDYRGQERLREILADKQKEITEYERRLKATTFTFNKADSTSQRGHRSAKKMLGASDTLFERLSEHLTERMAVNGALETWFDRPFSK
jgi:hypothetical protein